MTRTRSQAAKPPQNARVVGVSAKGCLFALCASGLLLAACAPRLLSLPVDPGSTLPDFERIHREATAGCANVRTLTAELALSGRAGSQRVRGTAIVGFEGPRSLRLEGVAPFGPPAFILAARDETAILLLPRDNRVLRGARAEEILGALTGVALAPAELQAVLTGCASAANGGALAGRMHANGWASIDLSDGAVLYLERSADRWQTRAAKRSGWQIEYSMWQGSFPQTVRLRSTDPQVNVDITAILSQVEANVPIDQAAFDVNVPPSARELSLSELRANGPLGER
jgi:hypothetical protein